MAYSTAEQLQNNVLVLANTYKVPATLALKSAAAIATADKIIRVDVSLVINTALIPAVVDTPATPEFINLLSQYKAAQFAVLRMTGARRTVQEETDIQFWGGLYSDLLADIKAGKIPLELSDGTNIGTGTTTFVNDALPDVKPRFGFGEYGEWLDKDELEEARDVEVINYGGKDS
jgi:hypothetical protein